MLRRQKKYLLSGWRDERRIDHDTENREEPKSDHFALDFSDGMKQFKHIGLNSFPIKETTYLDLNAALIAPIAAMRPMPKRCGPKPPLDWRSLVEDTASSVSSSPSKWNSFYIFSRPRFHTIFISFSRPPASILCGGINCSTRLISFRCFDDNWPNRFLLLSCFRSSGSSLNLGDQGISISIRKECHAYLFVTRIVPPDTRCGDE